MELELTYENDYNGLLELINEQEDSYDTKLIRKAFELCVNAHKGQLRKSKEEYYIECDLSDEGQTQELDEPSNEEATLEE